MCRASIFAAIVLMTSAIAAPAAAQTRTTASPPVPAQPAPPKPKPPKPPQVIKVYFGAGTNELSDAAKKSLDNAVKKIEQQPYTNVAIEGHYDSSLPAAKAMDMSRRNANAVADYLKSHGVDAKRLKVSAVGSPAPAEGAEEQPKRSVIITITPRKKTNAEADAEYAAAMEVYQRQMKAHDQKLKQYKEAQAQFRADKAARTKAAREAKAQYRQAKAEADAARAAWKRRVAACKAGDYSQCGG
jgi:outer membrane protein OmpA-like peptidoglycan-associated protein